MPTQTDYEQWKNEFANDKSHQFSTYRKHFYERLGIAGSAPEVIEESTAKELGIAPKSKGNNEAHKAEGEVTSKSAPAYNTEAINALAEKYGMTPEQIIEYAHKAHGGQ